MSSVDNDYKQFIESQDLEDNTIVNWIDVNPRILFDVFDDHKVYIQINVGPNFSYSINQGDTISGSWETRIEAEKEAIEQAFIILEAKL